ncbi:hypothetical protein FRX31_008389 [Thalictrum thalictroides]|uniref:Uncharacterized protein n=1 Tax=Thalictrum thalictroides TaxID=46969 RepID=A0A7J6WX63_THATH|nr:hypothetical protein FRX31_008389 [Thalictrum thalictroides]
MKKTTLTVVGDVPDLQRYVNLLGCCIDTLPDLELFLDPSIKARYFLVLFCIRKWACGHCVKDSCFLQMRWQY